jgi:polar amino acid transport system substrate-binding protein
MLMRRAERRGQAVLRSFAAMMLASVLAAPRLSAACEPAVSQAELVKPGTLVMSTNPTLPPLQYIDSSGTLKGMRITLGTEIAKRLCLNAEYIRIDFDAMVPGLAAGRWDMIDTGIFLTPARVKIMQMIPYEQQAISISVRKSDAGKVMKLDDLAGKTIGVEIGGFEEQRARDIAKQVSAKGLPAATVRTFDSFSAAYQALGAGQLDAVVSIDGVAKEYEQRDAFARPISGLDPTPVALALKSRPLAEAVARALNDMKADGSYDKLLGQYGLAPMAGPFAVSGPPA